MTENTGNIVHVKFGLKYPLLEQNMQLWREEEIRKENQKPTVTGDVITGWK